MNPLFNINTFWSIIRHLNSDAVLKCSIVCKTLHQHCQREDTWDCAILSIYGNSDEYKKLFNEETFRETFKMCWKIEKVIVGLGLQSNIVDTYKMTELVLKNKHVGVIPKQICVLKNLEKIDFTDNALTEVPNEIGQLVNLKEIILSDNDVKFIHDDIQNLPKLELLDLTGNPDDNNLDQVIGNEEHQLFLECRAGLVFWEYLQSESVRNIIYNV